ncbi:CS1-pili formation C-terminal domain-containing protein [Pseudomonas synxantha]|uniref:CS1-pili formation C-terminal domain-containing protein n=1 Tax=Pseudomonas synxantha TaxID=47883 RepID=A0ABS0UK42_9PSED|nr:CS1-pili formation C-terminal domain-containing protein [Pseudomonas synxantha]MBI6565966.1 CS1-pili formation C-terminal domain-containing protein [Pseudomonas synxantha]MBI6580748.1 CS1-pili formation C-terminal domain-containing protein [Pseudomonas synxantha]MBI6645335.1 CS1-pili formation C-terminal domain-containing protein [Pseudomonas synxantha]
MFPMTPIATALALLIGMSALSAPASAASTPGSLITQAQGLPSGFADHFFEVPLAVRVDLDQQLLGEALIVLSRDDRVTLLEFTDTGDSKVPATTRDTWQTILENGVALGACTQACPQQMVSAFYNLESSQLSIITQNVEHSDEAPRYYDQPENGSLGLIINNQLNLNGGQEDDLGGRYGLQASSSIGNWSQLFNLQLARQSGNDETLRHAIHELYTQRELEGNFFRLGHFTPNSDGLTRQLRSFGASPDTALGLMYGSSDSLAINNPKPSVYPIYVTANRQAAVEIYRNGLLINTQAVAAGLQTLDTRPLPGGIYEVEVRLIEDGLTVSTTQELVYKPSNWRNAEDRWRYNLFAGRETKLFSNWDEQASGSITAGASINYLLHPRVVLGLSAREVREQLQYGGSVDWTVANNVSVYANLFQTQDHGTGMDLQGLYSFGATNLVFSHNRSWLDTRDTYETLPDGTRLRRNTFVGQTSNSSLSINHRIDAKNSLNMRVFHSEGNVEGAGLDLGWNRRDMLMGSDANWRFSLFDRPGTGSTNERRNRGVDVSLSLALGSDGRQVSGSIGSRTARDGGRDNNASVTFRQDLTDHVLQSVSATATTDTYGVGLSGMTSFSTDAISGDGFLQRSSYNGDVTGGLNLNSTLVMGAGEMLLSSQYQGNGAGMIVDVETDLDAITLRADDLSGGSAVLRPGRNYVPVSAYKSSTVSFDFEGNHPPAANIQPARSTYHLNKGGVDYRKITVMKTVTVLGRLLDAQGAPLKGHQVINHASRGVSEVDGFFSMEMSASAPTLEVRYQSQLLCQFRLDPTNAPNESDVLMIGDLRCTPDTLAEATLKVETAG